MRTVLTQTKLATVSFACYYRITRRRSGAGPPRNKCTPVYITHQMNAQRARLRPAYYSLATAGGANKIRSSTWVLSDTNRLATVQPHSAVHEQTASLQPHPKGLPIIFRCISVENCAQTEIAYFPYGPVRGPSTIFQPRTGPYGQYAISDLSQSAFKMHTQVAAGALIFIFRQS